MPFNPWRKKVKKVFAIGCLTVLALAAGSVAKADDFKGAYVGVTVGDSIARSDAQTTTVFSSTGYFAMSSVTAIGTSGAQRTTPSGFAGGGLVGYNFYHNGNVIMGVEADFTALKANDVKTVTTNYTCGACTGTAFTITQQVSANWLLTARPRVGYLWGHALIYGTGGIAATHTDMHELFTDTFASAHESGVVARNVIGWTVGGGIEYPVVPHLSVRAECLYAAFGRGSTTSTNLTATSAPGSFPMNVFTNSNDFHTHIVRAGLTWRF
jgi:outer membrane immunogenic protein